MNLPAIDQIKDLYACMQEAIDSGKLKQLDPPVDHYFAQGLYGRRIYVPGGTTVVTKVHMTQHITIALKGKCTMFDENGQRSIIEAPGMWVTEPGTYRAIYCHDNVEWVTVHASDKTDVQFAEFDTFADDYVDFLQRVSVDKPKRIDAAKFLRLGKLL